jgi:hypothetical protein
VDKAEAGIAAATTVAQVEAARDLALAALVGL